MRVLITIEYLGTSYCGWQKQKNGRSVQETLAKAISTLTAEEIVLHGSGRTDSGVHAIAQAAHFDTNTKIPVEKLPYAINSLLPRDISVKSARSVVAAFNARFDAISKTYIYKIYTGAHLSPTRELTHCHIPYALDVQKMREAASRIIGTHDFKCFQSTGGHVKDTVRTIYTATVTESGDEILIEVKGNGFLYNMVRIIAGTLVYAGIGKLSAEDITSAISSRDRTRAGKTLDAKGLYLKNVEYDFGDN
ncbi:MAG: tRNA pseudouridine(38-40) synthase TruA [Clostridia bacterium]|nr:tRNA pseudouridine(38-40) synthase TruA [Clostridia bacterium]